MVRRSIVALVVLTVSLAPLAAGAATPHGHAHGRCAHHCGRKTKTHRVVTNSSETDVDALKLEDDAKAQVKDR